MKQQWLKFAARIDALSLRERVLIFAAVAAAVVFIAYFSGLGPTLRKYEALRGQISQQRNNLAGLDDEIVQKVSGYRHDPDATARARLAAVRAGSAQLGENLRAMQRGLVAPERMATLLDTILRANGRLQLVSMKTLPIGALNDGAGTGAPKAAAAGADAASATSEETAMHDKLLSKALTPVAQPPAAAGAARPAGGAHKAGSLLYRHGVEVAVRGNYLDMIDYMNALEALPTQLFWGGARLEVEEYPAARLTLTLYTLSLDPKWMKL
jgi:MSHA biogenesis protein MshJ